MPSNLKMPVNPSHPPMASVGDPSPMGIRSRVLVLGGLGFIGSHLSRMLLRRGYTVRIFDARCASVRPIEDIKDQVEIQMGDANQPNDVLAALGGIDVAIDLIHTTVPGASMQHPGHDVQSNVVSHVGWLSKINNTSVRRIIYVSSGGTIYGVPKTIPIREDHPTEPICSYGITKLAIEKYVAMYAKSHGIEYRICRPANAYGEGQRLNVAQGAIGVFLERCLKGQAVHIWGDGTVTRDYIYATDLARAIACLMSHQGAGRVFNISSGKGHSLNSIVSIMRDELGLPVDVKYLPPRTFDVPVNVLDSSLLESEAGWRPETDLVSGMRRAWESMQSSPAGF